MTRMDRITELFESLIWATLALASLFLLVQVTA